MNLVLSIMVVILAGVAIKQELTINDLRELYNDLHEEINVVSNIERDDYDHLRNHVKDNQARLNALAKNVAYVDHMFMTYQENNNRIIQNLRKEMDKPFYQRYSHEERENDARS